MSAHLLLTPETCDCRERGHVQYCPVCDGGALVCANCGRANDALDYPCVPRQTVGAALREWLRVVPWMQAAKAREKELRLQLLEQLFIGPGVDAETTGTRRADYVDPTLTVTLKASNSLEYTVLPELVDATLKALPLNACAGLIRWKPSLDVAIYKKLAPEHRAIVDRMLSVKPSSTQLEPLTKNVEA